MNRKIVVFLDTEKYVLENVIQNKDKIKEAKIIGELIKKGTMIGKIEPTEIGIITPFRAQIKEITNEMKIGIKDPKMLEELNSIEISTIDKFQGRDKSLIIISLSYSNESENENEMLAYQWNRLNVAFTRAKYKMIIVASLHQIKGKKIFSELLEFAHNNNFIHSF